MWFIINLIFMYLTTQNIKFHKTTFIYRLSLNYVYLLLINKLYNQQKLQQKSAEQNIGHLYAVRQAQV